MKANELKSFIERLNQLPALPSVAFRLLELVGNGHFSFSEATKLIESDPALTSRILRISNSSHFGMSRRVSTLESAIQLLGLDLVARFSLSLVSSDLVGARNSGSSGVEHFWRHSLGCAMGSKLLAERLGYADAKEAYVAGLLHDLGKFVFLQWNGEEYGALMAEARSKRTSLLHLEESRLGMGHTQAAKLLMSHWEFPSSILLSAWLHHQPVSYFGPQPREQLPFVVKCANNLLRLYGIGGSPSSGADLDRQQLADVTGLSAEDLTQIAAQVEGRIDTISGAWNEETVEADRFLPALSRANQKLAQLDLDLTVENRELARQRAMMLPIRQLQEELPPRVTPGRALVKVLELLQTATGAGRLMGFIFPDQEAVSEVRLKVDSALRNIVLPLRAGQGEHATRLKPREQFSLLEEAILELDGGSAVNTELKAFLRSGHLIVLPLEAGGQVLGQIVIELMGTDWNEPEALDLLRQYARAAAAAMERVFLVDALDQQAEYLARSVRREQEIQARLHQAHQLASVGRLAAGAAHEINNPLAAILLQAELLLKQTKSESQCRALELIVEQSRRVSGIIGDLMGFARPTQPNVESTNVRSVLSQALRVLENRIKVQGVELRLEYEDLLPPVNADPRQLEQVFLNLAINGLQAMPTGGMLTIRVGVDHMGEGLLIEFSDSGVGIRSEELSSIFDPFYTTKEAGEGTGLGLAICYSIIKSHGGEIKASSQSGRGSVFSIRLPLASGPATGPVEVTEAPVVSVDWNSTKDNLNVLLVEDEDAVRELLSETLSEYGYSVDVAADGWEGLARLEHRSFDVILLDLRMPRKEGLEVLKTVRDRFPHMPVIVISGVTEDGMFRSAKEAGAIVCIKKPFRVDEVLAAIRTVPSAIAAATG